MMFPFAQNRALNGETANKLLHLLSPSRVPPLVTVEVGVGGARQSPCLSQCHCQCIHLKDYKRICRLFAAKWTHLPAAGKEGRESGQWGRVEEAGKEEGGCGSQ